MTTIREALTLAVDHHRAGQVREAEGIYRLILAVSPDNAIALHNLGLLIPPDDPGALVSVATALQSQGRLDDAAATCERALALAPRNADALFRLGHILQAQGRLDEAAAQYDQALAEAPACTAALCNLGAIYGASGQAALAATCYRRALAIDDDLTLAHLNLAGILEAEGRLGDARPHRDRVPRPQPLLIQAAPAPSRTVLILANAGKGNVPLDSLLPPASTSRILWHVEYATDAQMAHLPHYDVAINAIGNPDLMEESRARIDRLHTRRRLLNPPGAVAQTRRDRLPGLLAGIPGLLAPPVVRLDRAALGAPDLAVRLAAAGITGAALVRPIVGHGGDGVMLAPAPEQVAALALPEADGFYVSAYVDYRSADGCFRKYRMIFVDRQPYAYHLAISGAWLVHYFSADMLAAPWKRAEEQRFLEDPAAVLGKAAMSAITAIARRIDLDFAGIDFSILPDGRLLVFEANATMLVHLRDAIEDFPYKHTHVPAIFRAFEAMLDDRRA